jgi:hypothetical protein
MRMALCLARRGCAWVCIGLGASIATAQTPQLSLAERECAEAVQGKVAWNQAGTRQWQSANVARLCASVTDVNARIGCFQEEVKRHNDWSRGIAACTGAAAGTATPTTMSSTPAPPAPSASPAAPAVVIDLTGQWTKLAADGGGSGGFGDLVTVRQKGRVFIADIDAINYADPPGTPPKRSTIHGEVRSGSIRIAGSNEIAKIEGDRIIRFADGSYWVRRSRQPTAP